MSTQPTKTTESVETEIIMTIPPPGPKAISPKERVQIIYMLIFMGKLKLIRLFHLLPNRAEIRRQF